MLDLEWNKPVATAHPLGIDIEVRFQKFLAFRSNLFMLVKVTLCIRQIRNKGFFQVTASLLAPNTLRMVETKTLNHK